MTPAPMLWHTYSGGDPVGWLVSEKLDGVRAIWDGARLISRSGRTIAAPAWFIAGLPDQPLDGELYAGPGTLARVQGLARRTDAAGADWHGVRFCLFDAPAAPGGFARRLDALGRTAARLPAHVEIVPHHPVDSRAWLLGFYRTIVRQGGEGVVIRHPAGPYQPGQRTQWALKIKQHPDTLGLLMASGERFSVAA